MRRKAAKINFGVYQQTDKTDTRRYRFCFVGLPIMDKSAATTAVVVATAAAVVGSTETAAAAANKDED